MVFPATPIPIVGELLINGTWVDVTSRIRGEHTIKITRGRRDIQGNMPPSFCDFTLNNADGTFTDDNPSSPYFEQLPLYTQFRLRATGAADGYMYTSGFDTIDYARTTDKAQLDVVGDVDVMVDMSPASWNLPNTAASSGAATAILASKAGDFTAQFSWAFGLRSDGKLYFAWSTTGVGSAGIGVTSTVAVTPSDRLAVRASLDVNNGAGGYTLRFYTSDSIDGTWTLLGAAVTAAGVTSIFSSTGNLEVGAGAFGTGIFTGGRVFSGRIYAMRMYSGLFGGVATKVAECDFRSQAVGTIFIADGLGNTFEVRNNAYVTSDAIRAWTEVETFPQEWDATGRDVFARIHSADIVQRLQTSQTPVASPIYTNRIQLDPTGYWPMEDGAEATQASSAARQSPAAVVRNVHFKAADDLPGSDGCVQFDDATAFIRGQARQETVSGTTSLLFYFKFGTAPVSSVPLIAARITGSSTISEWRIATDGVAFTTTATDLSGGNLLTNITGTGGVDLTQWVSMRLELTTSGANVAWAIAWTQIGEPTFFGNSGTIAGAVGRFGSFTIQGSAASTDMYAAHVVLDNATTSFVTSDFYNASNGYIGERYSDRFRRLCLAAGIGAELEGWEMDTSLCGRQRVDTLLNILQDGAKVDGGLLLGSRRQGNTLLYVTRARVQTEQSVVTLQHNTASHLAAPPRPTKDSTGVTNDVTVRRPSGGFSRVTVTDGRYGTDSIGFIPSDETINVNVDDDTATQAGWLALLGSDPNKRFPDIAVALHRTETLLGSSISKQILAVDAGRWLVITSLPSGQAPDQAEQLIQGYTETMSNKLWDISFNGTAYQPWKDGIVQGALEPIRMAATSTTVSAATSTATSLTFTTPSTSRRWVTTADVTTTPFPFDVVISGERITVTNIVGTGTVQTATVTRSVNGVVKAITGGATVQLFRVFTIGRT